MSEVLFDIVFKGKFVNTIDLQKAVLHFSKLFKLPPEKAGMFFDGKARTLKKNLPMEKASHMREVLKKAGLRVSLIKQDNQPDRKNVQHVTSALTMSEVGAIIVNKAFVPPKHYDTSQIHMDEVGVEIVHKEKIAEPEFDLSEFQLDEIGIEIVHKQHIPKINIDTSDMTMDEVGAVFSEKKNIPDANIDISQLTMDEPGTTIVQKSNVPKPDINTDNIKLDDEF